MTNNDTEFKDGLTSLTNKIENQRSSTATNAFTTCVLSDSELSAIYHTGLGNKICRLKIGAALGDALIFKSDDDRDFYNSKLSSSVMDAAKFMLAFGRGVLVLFKTGDDLLTPLIEGTDPTGLRVEVFDGSEVSVSSVSLNLMDPRYNKPASYMVRANQVHWSRVIDLTYVRPPNRELPLYRYGGIPEFELIYTELVNDGIIERSVGKVIEKNASMFYKVEGFKTAMRAKQEGDIVNYFTLIESMRTGSGATILDKEDSAEILTQAMSNLADVDQISLRRIAMVTGIALPQLVGESATGLNSAGTTERAVTGQTIKDLQNDYLRKPLQRLFNVFELGQVEFVDTQGATQKEELDIETAAIDNAMKLMQLGEDYTNYLVGKGVITEEDAALSPDDDNEDLIEDLIEELENAQSPEAP